MADEFVKSVEDGLKLSKRIYFGKDRSVSPPKLAAMDKGLYSLLPAAPMVYAVIADPAIVDNPDIPSYQPHVHGRCDPPALIPLQMNGVSIETDCFFDTASVTVSGSWRVHCVMASRSCDCRIAIPLGEQGSILGVEIHVTRRSYYTKLITMEDTTVVDKSINADDGGFLKPQIFTVTVPKVDGGSNLSIKVNWSQKILCHDGQFSLKVPFSFPEYVTPAGKKISKREKIQLNVNCGTDAEVLCKTTSHPLKELRRQVGKLGFLYEAEVLTWSNADFTFSYCVSSKDIFGGLLLQSPSMYGIDQREMFCFYLFPGNNQIREVFRKEVVFVVDISGSMRGAPLENAKAALSAILSKLNPQDSFSIIAFNGEIYMFSSSMELATKETIENAIQWIGMNFIAGGDTNILLPLNQAIRMLSKSGNSIPHIFLITDGAVEDERHICNLMRNLTNSGSTSFRISTFGIGTFCNHYFLKMLAVIGRGHYDTAFDVDSIEARLQRFFTTAASAILVNITIDALENLDALEVYPSRIPDLLSGSPLLLSGRYRGNLPESVKARGMLADTRKFEVNLKVQKAKDMPLDKVLAKQEIDLITAHSWFMESEELKNKVAKMSIQTGIPSEFTRMVLVQTDRGKQASEAAVATEMSDKIEIQKLADGQGSRIVLLRSRGIGFGNLAATAENTPPGFEKVKPLEPAEIFVKAASNCCGRLCGNCCCFCCIKACSRLNDQCAIALTQLCASLACLGCLSCCSAVCSNDK